MRWEPTRSAQAGPVRQAEIAQVQAAVQAQVDVGRAHRGLDLEGIGAARVRPPGRRVRR